MDNSDASGSRAAPRERRNPALWVVIGIPAIAVVASLTSVTLAYRGGDVPLPDRYHWEGSQLSADQARLDAAARRAIGADFGYDAGTGQCRVVLQGAAPATLQLDLAHATRSGLDQHVALQRAGDAYVGACAPLAPGSWWLQLADDHDDWLLRQRIKR
jgi:hypothetical protein